MTKFTFLILGCLFLLINTSNLFIYKLSLELTYLNLTDVHIDELDNLKNDPEYSEVKYFIYSRI
jgi:hypothetical protein